MVGPASQAAPCDAPEDTPTLPSGSEDSAGGSHRGSSWPRRILVGALCAVGAVTLIAVVAVALTLMERHNYSGRALPGVELDGVSSSGRKQVAIYDSVARLGVTLARSPIRVRIADDDYTAGPSLLDLSVDADASTRAAMDAGRQGNLFGQVLGTALRRIRPDEIKLRVVYDVNRLEGMLDGWSAEVDSGAIEGGLRFKGTQVVPIEPRTGTGIERASARAALERMLGSSHRTVVELPVGTLRPQVDRAAVASAARRARKLLVGNIALATGLKVVVVKPPQLARALGTHVRGHALDLTLDAERLHAAIGPDLARLETPPVDASFAVTEANTVRVIPSRPGREIDMNAVAREILSGQRRIVAPLLPSKPLRTTKWATALGIVRQVGGFTTNYPEGEARVTNIHRGADLLNNTIVEPGQTFSLNRAIGPRTSKRGFVTAPVFAEGEFFDDYGGGVSQLATTVYNAAFFAGYPDVTHQPHTIYISRYPPGREATVNYGAIDLQFRNDTKHGILIRTYYGADSITVSLYGDNNGRSVREENRAESNPVPVADSVIQCPASATVDPHDLCATLPAGETEQISNGDPGFDVAFDRVITEPGRPERREHYTWHYTMLPNQILLGGNAVPNTAETPATTAPSTPETTASTTPPSTAPSSTKPATSTTLKPS